MRDFMNKTAVECIGCHMATKQRQKMTNQIGHQNAIIDLLTKGSRRVFICSPLRSDTEQHIEGNKQIALAMCRLAANKGLAPFAPHLFYTQFLDDNIEQERNIGIESGISFMHACDLIWVLNTKLTEGMRSEIGVWIKTRLEMMKVAIGQKKGVDVIKQVKEIKQISLSDIILKRCKADYDIDISPMSIEDIDFLNNVEMRK